VSSTGEAMALVMKIASRDAEMMVIEYMMGCSYGMVEPVETRR
jgi:hypothetical protein